MEANGTNVSCVVLGPGAVECDGVEYFKEQLLSARDGLFWAYLFLYIGLVLFAGLMSGLTLGLLSLDVLSLEVLKRGGKPKEQRYAARILILVKKHHLLLVTLLLSNAVAVEAMPVFLAKITNEIVAIIVSVTAVLLFGEIIPQALCTRYGLAIGYYCAPVVFVLMAALYPIAFPIAMLLDRILGKDHGTFFRRAELRELVKIHGTKAHDNEEPLTYDEVLIVKSALEMRDKTVQDAMTPVESVFMLSITALIDRPTMNDLLHRGHSRVPVYDGDHGNIVGLLLVKKLIKLDPDDCTPVRSLDGAHAPPPSCLTSTPLYDLLNLFQTGRSHLALVYKEEDELAEPELVGIITLEDVIEELIGEEIVDETDLYVDVHRRVAVARARLTYHRQSISAPAAGASATQRRHPRRLQRSKSETYAPKTNLLSPAKETPSSGRERQDAGLPMSSSVPSNAPLIPIPEGREFAINLSPTQEMEEEEEEERESDSMTIEITSDTAPLLGSDS